MKAAVLTRPQMVELLEVDRPVAGPGHALVRTRCVGVCGTDLKIYSGRVPVNYPRIMGHEIAGEVIAATDESLPVGERVLVDPGVTCGTCPQCRAGRGNICTGGWLMGRDRDGGLRDVFDVPAANLHSLPRSIDTDLAPLLQVLATCVHGLRLAPILPGTAVVVVGLGVTGLLHLQLAKLEGAHPLVGVTRSGHKLELARSLGADTVVRADTSSEQEEIFEATGGGADLVIECVGTVATLGKAVQACGVGGRILAYGTIAQTEGAFPFYDLYYKELVVTSPRSANGEDFPAAIEAVAGGRVALSPLVSDRFPLEQAGAAIEAAGRAGALKVLVDV